MLIHSSRRKRRLATSVTCSDYYDIKLFHGLVSWPIIAHQDPRLHDKYTAISLSGMITGMVKRVHPTPSQKKRLLKANAHRCCVCKRSGIGFEFHHIDHDPAHTVDENLAVLCVEEHDKEYRPMAYQKRASHLQLTADEIRKCKTSWESFVAEARKEQPIVMASVTCFGARDLVHSVQLVLQWPDERIEYEKSFHLLDGDFDLWTDEILKELQAIGPNLKLALIGEPQPVEHCPCCGKGLSHVVDSAFVIKMTNPLWASESICSIYVNPDQAKLAILIFFQGRNPLFSGSLRLCQGRYLHYECDYYDERLAVQDQPSVRAQASEIVRKVLNEWEPAQVLVRTGDPDSPILIDDLVLPKCWDQEARR